MFVLNPKYYKQADLFEPSMPIYVLEYNYISCHKLTSHVLMEIKNSIFFI